MSYSPYLAPLCSLSKWPKGTPSVKCCNPDSAIVVMYWGFLVGGVSRG